LYRRAFKDSFIKDYKFIDKIINSLPGIFYLYESYKDDFRLIVWNKNHETSLGYTAKELWHKPWYEFYSEPEIKKIKKALAKVFSEGRNSIVANPKTKNR